MLRHLRKGNYKDISEVHIGKKNLVFEGDASVVYSLRHDFPEDRSGIDAREILHIRRLYLSSVKNEFFLEGKTHGLVIFPSMPEDDH